MRAAGRQRARRGRSTRQQKAPAQRARLAASRTPRCASPTCNHTRRCFLSHQQFAPHQQFATAFWLSFSPVFRSACSLRPFSGMQCVSRQLLLQRHPAPGPPLRVKAGGTRALQPARAIAEEGEPQQLPTTTVYMAVETQPSVAATAQRSSPSWLIPAGVVGLALAGLAFRKITGDRCVRGGLMYAMAPAQGTQLMRPCPHRVPCKRHALLAPSLLPASPLCPRRCLQVGRRPGRSRLP